MANVTETRDHVDPRLHSGQQRNLRYFDAVAPRYFDWYGQNTQGGVSFRLRRQRVMELFDKPGERVLDAGCGPGVFVDELVARGCTYFGIDHSSQMIAECQTRYESVPNVHFSVARVEATGLPSQSMDAVICVGVLERIEDNDAVLAELARVLRVGGTLIVTHSNRVSPYFIWLDYVYRPIGAKVRHLLATAMRRDRPPASPRHVLQSGRGFAEQVRRHGCDVTDLEYSSYPLLLPPLDRLLPRAAAAITLRTEELRHHALRGLGAVIILRARRL